MSDRYRSAGDFKREEFGGLDCDPNLDRAQQQFKEEADIQTIVKRFGLSGQMPTTFKTPSYGDFTGVGDYREALHAVQEAQEQFQSLPAEMRRRFDNDPQMLLQFVGDAANREEAIKLGLIPKPPEVTRDAAGGGS